MASTFELRHYLAIAKAKVVVTDPSHRVRAEEAIAASPSLQFKPIVIELGGSEDAVGQHFSTMNTFEN